MELSGFRTSIHSDGEQLKEYSIEVSPDGKKVTCWIPSQSGKEFAVKYRVRESSVIKDRAKAVDLYMDGHRMRKYALLPDHMHGKFNGARISENAKRPFTFADIRTTDEDTVPDDIHVKPDEIGTISVQVFLVENWRRIGPPKEYRIQEHPPAVIDEQSKKAGGHCVSLGDEQACAANPWSYSMDYDHQKPDLVFEFHYHSTAMLQALGIIPPPKRGAPTVIDLEDGDFEPPPKRQKATESNVLIQTMQVRLEQTELERLRNRVGELEEKKPGPSGVKKEAMKHDPADIIDLT
ncbi:hypothetical protein BDM02DRAFT_3271155 [Thelephora ganbajun]|uniref:Uncharacterized protein n=1 Tax=Thelephora ganbajun TaxID=370292 RepID=A0ACB6Z989_THEGA|nr:hypothetical protein BDM02DRAFT_3271155 [Thelephora ganbajun]